jgi:hypothetical protein
VRTRVLVFLDDGVERDLTPFGDQTPESDHGLR